MKRNQNAADCPEKAVCINNLTVNYGKTPAIEGVSFNVEDGDYLGIIGPNGGGKTTLLKSIVGLIPITSGEITIYGKKAGKAKKLIGYVPQIASLNRKFPLTVHESVMTGMLNPSLTFFHKYKASESEKSDELLNKVGIYSLRDKMISELSGGEFQKMLIARALAIDPKLLILDEPTASVDEKSRKQIFTLLNELNENMTIILVTHDLLAMSSCVKTLACMKEKLVYYGKAELNSDIVNTLYGCSMDMIPGFKKENA